MKYHVLVPSPEGGHEHFEVSVSRAGSGWKVSMLAAHSPGQAEPSASSAAPPLEEHLLVEEHLVDVGRLRDGHAYSLIIDDRSVDIGVEELGHQLDLLIGGGRYSVEVLGEREWLARSIQGDSDEGERNVAANMTGIVRDVLVAPGDAVVKGQTIFILEAMKMENEVKAQVDGTVTAVLVEPGAAVTLGDPMLEIE